MAARSRKWPASISSPPDGQPWRLGYAIGNEYSDHVMERQNYLYLAHSKLRACAIGPELLLGDLPESVEGESRIWRNGSLLWKKAFVSGEKNMSHTISNLEFHHFKYRQFRRPGDLHVHFFGTATLSALATASRPSRATCSRSRRRPSARLAQPARCQGQ